MTNAPQETTRGEEEYGAKQANKNHEHHATPKGETIPSSCRDSSCDGRVETVELSRTALHKACHRAAQRHCS